MTNFSKTFEKETSKTPFSLFYHNKKSREKEQKIDVQHLLEVIGKV